MSKLFTAISHYVLRWGSKFAHDHGAKPVRTRLVFQGEPFAPKVYSQGPGFYIVRRADDQATVAAIVIDAPLADVRPSGHESRAQDRGFAKSATRRELPLSEIEERDYHDQVEWEASIATKTDAELAGMLDLAEYRAWMDQQRELDGYA